MNAPTDIPAQLRVFERGWLSSNNVLFVGSGQTALVDTGYATHAEQTLALLADALKGRPLDLVLNTHLHSDHCGGNAALQLRYPAIQTFIPAGEASAVQHWDEERLSYRATGQQCPRFAFNGLVEAGREVTLGDLAWQVHAAPGHDPHSIVLFEPRSRTLVSADALWENGFGIVFPELAGEPSFDQVASTLDLIESLAPAWVIPGHGKVFNDTTTALSAARRRLEAFAGEPKKHARHAIKVLLKFKLLEYQVVERKEWDRWIRETPYFSIVCARFFAPSTPEELCAEVLSELIKAGAATADEHQISNG